MTDLVCRGCGLLICSVRDIVNMNSEGTSSHFVNSGKQFRFWNSLLSNLFFSCISYQQHCSVPAGYIHEMVTVAVAQNFVPRDQPCAKFSWFPGYVIYHFSIFFINELTMIKYVIEVPVHSGVYVAI